MLTLFKDIYYSFPFQLLLLSVKRHQFLLFIWVFLFIIIIGKFGAGIGVPAVLLDPEYLGKVGYLSFATAGLGFGAMYVTWNVVIYILHSHRFPFMASLQYPLGMFFINNSLIPAAFIITYFITVFNHQINNEYQNLWDVAMDLVGFSAGFLLSILITALYFGFANRSPESYIKSEERERKKRKVPFDEISDYAPNTRVDYYVTNRLNIRHTRTVEHYGPSLQQLVFRRHHLNAFIAFLFAFAFLISIGFFLENPFFQIPIASSAFLFLSILISLFGMFLYWTGTWGSIAIIAFLLVANQLTKYDLFGSQSEAYGLNYKTEQAKYTLANLRALSTDSIVTKDMDYFLPILENWKKKNTDPRFPDRKPKMYFVNVSGGGLRSAMYTTVVMQRCDSILEGTLFDKTFMITGASGGMLGATNLREIYLKQKEGYSVDWRSREHAYNVSKDLLNPVALAILSNDGLLPFRRFKLGDKKYIVDRGYALERGFCRNTDFRFNKTIDDYRIPEYEGRIPLMIYHTAIMNDSRRYFISPHPVSFLMRPLGKNALSNRLEIDGVDFCRFFEKQEGNELLVTSAMRMNATFPFILPNPVLPSEPPTYVMDGGALDNFGVETSIRFLKAFKDWINQNTSGVVILQIRDSEKMEEPEEAKQKTLFSRLTDPLGTVYNNMENMHDFLTDYRIDDMDEEMKGKLSFVLFEYIAESKAQRAAMSFHLTTRDKNEIINSLDRPNNIASFRKLGGLAR
ncbi:MAG: patatin-like phospholipase family protein [Chitinophagales bacterium]|nr:patatin-like phospholipase family protein [Chitinophagales bacterium]